MNCRSYLYVSSLGLLLLSLLTCCMHRNVTADVGRLSTCTSWARAGCLRLPLDAPPACRRSSLFTGDRLRLGGLPALFLPLIPISPPSLSYPSLRPLFIVVSRVNRISSWLNCCRIPICCINRVAADAPLAVPRIVRRLVVLSGLIHESRSFFHRLHDSRTCRTVILLGPHAQRGDS